MTDDRLQLYEMKSNSIRNLRWFEWTKPAFLVQSLIETVKRKVQFLCKSPFYSDTASATSVMRIVSKIWTKNSPRGKKWQIVIQINQSNN